MIYLKSFFSRSLPFAISILLVASCSVLQPDNPYAGRNTGDPMVPTRKINRVDPPRGTNIKIIKTKGLNPPSRDNVKIKKTKGVAPPPRDNVKIKKTKGVKPSREDNKRYLNNNKRKKEKWTKVKPVRGWDCPWDRSFTSKSKGKINKKLKKAKRKTKK